MKLKGIEYGWYAPGDEIYENCDATYCFIPFHKIPDLNQEIFNGDFQWLTEIRNEFEDEFGNISLFSERNNIDHFDEILNSVRQMNITLPKSFQQFFKDLKLQKKIPTCTSCWLELSDEIIPLPENDDCYMLRFLNDQQGVLLWYLCFNKKDEHCVVASQHFYEKEIQMELYREIIDDNELLKYSYYCSTSFEEFIYRFWIENTLWFCLTQNLALNDFEQEYLDKIEVKKKEATEQ